MWNTATHKVRWEKAAGRRQMLSAMISVASVDVSTECHELLSSCHTGRVGNRSRPGPKSRTGTGRRLFSRQ